MTLSFQLAMSSSPLSLASSVPSSPSFRDEEWGWGDLPELLRFGDQPPSPPWDSDAERHWTVIGVKQGFRRLIQPLFPPKYEWMMGVVYSPFSLFGPIFSVYISPRKGVTP